LYFLFIEKNLEHYRQLGYKKMNKENPPLQTAAFDMFSLSIEMNEEVETKALYPEIGIVLFLIAI